MIPVLVLGQEIQEEGKGNDSPYLTNIGRDSVSTDMRFVFFFFV